MKLLPALWLLLPLAASALTPEDAEGRLRVAMQMARERNDRALVDAVDQTGRQIKAALRTGQADGLDAALRDLETRAGLDPGGWSMSGQPIFHPTPQLAASLPGFGPQLNSALSSGDPGRVRTVTSTLLKVLGDQAGVPDARRPGRQPAPLRLSPAEATGLFLRALDSQDRYLRQLRDARPLPDQMLRFYAYLLDALTTARPFVQTHQPDRLPDLDSLSAGLATLLLRLQQPPGFFPFPDLRGRNIRFGDMIERQVRESGAEVQDGWLITPEPAGGTQFDTGVCGAALLRAGSAHQRQDWRDAGLRAAQWALDQPCCANFNYNAFSVSLLSHAYRVSGDTSHLQGALLKFRLGVAPGQAPNGRWMDPHNARTVYHLIILRSLGDLAAALPASRNAELAEVEQCIRPALRALLDEFDAMGLTVDALPELLTLLSLDPGNHRLSAAVDRMASGIASQCTDGKRFKLAVQPDQLAALVRWSASAR